MMQTILRFLVLFLALTYFQIHVAWAGPGWFWQNPQPTGHDLRAVWHFDADTLVAVGNFGTVLKTTDGGVTWTGPASGVTNALGSVAFTDANTGMAVGSVGTILHFRRRFYARPMAAPPGER